MRYSDFIKSVKKKCLTKSQIKSKHWKSVDSLNCEGSSPSIPNLDIDYLLVHLFVQSIDHAYFRNLRCTPFHFPRTHSRKEQGLTSFSFAKLLRTSLEREKMKETLRALQSTGCPYIFLPRT